MSSQEVMVKLVTDEESFLCLEHDWQDLLTNSAADKLFMSWYWQYCWWHSWGKELPIQLQLLIVYKAKQLIAILPLFSDEFQPRYSISRSRVQFIGNHWAATATVRTEYLSPIVHNDFIDEGVESLAHYLCFKMQWQEFIVCDSDSDNDKVMQLLLTEINKLKPITKNILAKASGYFIKAEQDGFSRYLASLGRSTRKKYFNDAKKCETNEMGYFEFTEEPEQFLHQLNNFHCSRWGKPVFTGNAFLFHLELIKRLNTQGVTSISCIKHNGQIVSVLYNIICKGVTYNIQAGFNETTVANLSLGKVHLGFSIKNAFEDSNIERLDLLAGRGKYSDYKAYLAGTEVRFETFSLSASKLVTLNYRVIDFLRKLKSSILGR